MTANLALGFRIDFQTAAAIQQVQALQRQFAGLQGIKPMGDPTAGLSSNLSSAGGSVTAFLGKLGLVVGVAATVVAAVQGIGAAFKAGLNVNAETESATLGIKSLVAALTTVKDSSGAVVTDMDKKLAISGTIAADEIKKLRIAGLETSATFQELLGAFQQGIGAGASAGLSLEKVRELTIGITQAAGALGMPMNQLNQEVRSLLSGDISADSTVAKALGITKKQVDGWREAGKLADELNKRLEVFKALGPESGSTWTATLSNVGDAFSLLLGEMTKGSFDGLKTSLQAALAEAFDVKTAGVAEAFSGIRDVGSEAFNAIGTVLSDALAGGITLAKDLSAWFVKHSDEVTELANVFGVVYENVKNVLGSIFSTVAAVASLIVQTGVISAAFKTIAFLAAGLEDAFQLVKGVLLDVGGTIIDKIGGPLRTVLGSLRDFVSQIPVIGTGLAAAIDSALKSIPESGAGMHALAKGIQADFDAGRTAVARTNTELSKTAAQLREVSSERKREENRMKGETPTGTALGKKAPDDGKKAKKAAEEYAAALRSYAAAESEAAKKVSQSLKEIAEVDLEKSLQARLVSYETYLAKKSAMEQAALAQELTAARSQLTVLNKSFTDEHDPAKKKKLEGDRDKVKAEITALENKSIVIGTKLKIDQEAFRRDVESLTVDIKANILDLDGNALGSASAKLAKETQDLLNDKRVTSDAGKAAGLPELVTQQGQKKQLQLDFNEQKRISDDRVATLSLAEERIALAVEQGQKTAIEGERAVREERLKTADAILAQVKALEALAAASPQNLEMGQTAAKARLEYDKLNTTLDATATSINHDLAGSLSGIVDSLGQGKNAIDSIGGALSSVFGSLAKRVLKQFENALFSALEGSSGQGLGGMLSGLLGSLGGGGKSSGGNNPSAFVGGSSGFNWGSLLGMFGFARGGYTGEGDKYEYAGPAHKGEFYYTKAEVAKMGLPFFYGMKNHIQSGSRAGFAEGGYTGGGSYSGGGLASVMQKSFSPTINNQMDFNPAMYFDLDHLAREIGKHPQFGRDVVNVVGKNSSKLGINR